MAQFYLIRHGEADYSHPTRWNAPGWGADLSPLTEKGLEQVRSILPELRELKPDFLLSSPMTRALQGAALLHGELNIPMQVESTSQCR
jgi:broad specificity phosphatase PhoE